MKKLFLFLIIGTAIWVAVRSGSRPAKTPPEPVKRAEASVTIIEGYQLTDIAARLENQGLVSAEEFLEAAARFDASSYPNVAARPSGASLEGYLFPDTYRIYRPTATTSPAETANALISRALANFEKKFTAEMAGQAKARGFTVHEAVTLASIVERETGRSAATDEQRAALGVERQTVAGIFEKRLKLGMGLEADSTVNYATGKSDPAVSLNDTKVNSPYNTYRHRGLPPGPIASPSLQSLEAVLRPKDTPYLYFLHAQPSGTVVYAETFEEHIKNKQRYLR